MSQSYNWVKIQESNDGLLLELVKNYLVSNHEIDAVIVNKQDSAYHIGKFELHVAAKNEKKALELISEYNRQNEN